MHRFLCTEHSFLNLDSIWGKEVVELKVRDIEVGNRIGESSKFRI